MKNYTLNRYVEIEYMIRSGFFFMTIGMFFLSACSSNEKKEPKKMVAKRTVKTVPKEDTHPGKIIYLQFCIACHMENGEGVPGLYPPLTQTDYILGEKKRLINVVLHGLEGPTEVKGEKYNNIMAKLDYLRDDQIAEVLSYIRSNFGNNADAVSAEEVRTVRSMGLK